MTSTIHWTKVGDALPEETETVLVAMTDGQVWSAYREGNEWFYVDGSALRNIAPGSVMAWAPYPDAPVKELLS